MRRRAGMPCSPPPLWGSRRCKLFNMLGGGRRKVFGFVKSIADGLTLRPCVRPSCDVIRFGGSPDPVVRWRWKSSVEPKGDAMLLSLLLPPGLTLFIPPGLLAFHWLLGNHCSLPLVKSGGGGLIWRKELLGCGC